MEALAEAGIKRESTSDALSVNIAGWLCEVSGKIVGFSMGDKDTGEMLVVAVLPEYENRGIGKRLMGSYRNGSFPMDIRRYRCWRIRIPASALTASIESWVGFRRVSMKVVIRF